ncbi:MAG: sigma-70 family RNA polymerase sigma factor [Planctomycetaceae bacterium]|nr:sigma-70 family RNA polymerase sigma factor [Planctomycetaceae bacterium]
MHEIDSELHREVLQRLRLARSGDEKSRNEICLQVQGYLLALAQSENLGYLQGKVNPSDIVQQTMTRMVSGLSDFRGESLPEFYGWLRTIMTNELRNLDRDWRRECRDLRREVPLGESRSGQALGLMDQNQTPSEFVLAQEKILRFYQALGQLPSEYQQVIRLRSLEELPFKEVGDQMGKTEGAATKLWFRAIVRFQEELDKLSDSQGL